MRYAVLAMRLTPRSSTMLEPSSDLGRTHTRIIRTMSTYLITRLRCSLVLLSPARTTIISRGRLLRGACYNPCLYPPSHPPRRPPSGCQPSTNRSSPKTWLRRRVWNPVRNTLLLILLLFLLFRDTVDRSAAPVFRAASTRAPWAGLSWSYLDDRPCSIFRSHEKASIRKKSD